MQNDCIIMREIEKELEVFNRGAKLSFAATFGGCFGVRE
jgi:hypothetical protein